jgi:multidrug resistance efflux pump
MRTEVTCGWAAVRAGVFVAFAIACAGCGGHTDTRNEPVTAPAVQTLRARAGVVAEELIAPGHIGPPAGSDAKLAFAVSGVLAAVLVRPGERVAAGQPLATLDRRAFTDALAQARADASAAAATFAGGRTSVAAATSAQAKYLAARAHLQSLRAGGPATLSDRIAAVSLARQSALKAELDRRALERTQALFTGGVSAAKDVEAARSLLASDLADQRSTQARVAAAGAGYDAALRGAAADAAQAASDLASARAGIGTAAAVRDGALAKLASARTDFARGTLYAPNDGIVVSVLKHPGEAVDPSGPVVDLIPPQAGVITVTLASADAGRVHPGDPVSLALTANGARATGRVEAVVPAVDAVTQSATAIVRGRIATGTAGQAVEATIVYGHTHGVLVPASAVVTDPQTARTVVFIRDRRSKDTPFRSREVAVRANDGTSAIVTGISAGDEIATQGAYDLLAPNGG